MIKKWLFNPFQFIAGWQAIIAGLVIMLITSILAYFSGAHFDGVLDAHFALPHTPVFPYRVFVYEQLNAWLCTFLLLYIAGFLSSKSKIRLIDVAGTISVARLPLFFASIIGFVPLLHLYPSIKNVYGILIWGLLLLLLFIWMMILLYNAYRISCNIKGTTAVWTFIVAIIFAEVISKIILQQIYFKTIH